LAKRWPCQPSTAVLQGVGATHDPLQTGQQICGRDEEGHSELFALYVLDNLLVNLWEERVWELGLCSPSSVVSHHMFQPGYNPLRGLGKYQQGRSYPVQPLENIGRMGLGYQAVQHFL
jgi:hypothetical protein